MANIHLMDSLPFANVTENIMLNDQQKLYKKARYLYCTNNDMLANIDPDINNLNPNGLTNQCKYYDTSLEFNKNISILYANICSSINKLNDFIYYIDNLDTTFNFIGLSETWATDSNKDLRSIPGYSHEQCIRSNHKRGGGTSLYIHNQTQYKQWGDLSFPKNIYESIFIEVDKSIFNTNRNVIIGEIYNPPSSKIKYFNTNLEKLLNIIKNEKKYAFLMGDYNVNTLIELKSSTTQMQDFSNIFSTFYYHKLINLPSSERKQSSTLLDKIYTNISDCYDTGTSGILHFLTQSDHYPIFTIRNNKSITKSIKYTKKRIHNNQNISKF